MEKYSVFLTTHRSGVAMFTIRAGSGEDIETRIRERIGRCLGEWDAQIKWDYFVEFER